MADTINAKEFKKIAKHITKKMNQKATKREIMKKQMQPVAKSLLQKHIKEEIIEKDFVDENNKYRYYVKKYGPGAGAGVKRPDKNGKRGGNGRAGVAILKLGEGRTQNTVYKKMDKDPFMVDEFDASGDVIKISNQMPVGNSIWGTEIRERSDPLLYTKWLVDGNIVMPHLYADGSRVEHWSKYTKGSNDKDHAAHWKAYVKDKKNRYKQRPFVRHALDELKESDSPYAKEMQENVAKEVRKIITKKFNKYISR